MEDKNTREIYRQRLQEQIDKVPERVRNGSIQVTRDWMRQRERAMKVLKKSGSTVTELMTALQSIQ